MLYEVITEGDADAVQIKAGGADGKYSLLYTSISDYVVETSQVRNNFV